MQALLQIAPGLDAVLCYNDLVAAGALQACATLGIRVPDDIAITGYDDIPTAGMIFPTLTTVHTPFQELGRSAASRLVSAIRGPVSGPNEIIHKPELVIRQSAP
jgi:LacI family transcriptional regulator